LDLRFFPSFTSGALTAGAARFAAVLVRMFLNRFSDRRHPNNSADRREP
jgi:hypothetical protein